MKYPYIGKNSPGSQVVIIYSDGSASHVAGEFKGERSKTYNTEDVKNITREYLEGKFVKIESPEYSEFILLICETNDITVANKHLNCNFAAFYDGAMFFCNNLPSDNFEQVTIPLPPKAEPKPKEWPIVGDTVTWGACKVIGVALAFHNDIAWILVDSGNYYEVGIERLEKPKTEAEILRDEIISHIDYELQEFGIKHKNVAISIQNTLTDKYNITKKPQ